LHIFAIAAFLRTPRIYGGAHREESSLRLVTNCLRESQDGLKHRFHLNAHGIGHRPFV
jgi:hypothetical protein